MSFFSFFFVFFFFYHLSFLFPLHFFLFHICCIYTSIGRDTGRIPIANTLLPITKESLFELLNISTHRTPNATIIAVNRRIHCQALDN